MSTNVLLVPIRVDAIYFENDRQIFPMADFSKMPYYNGDFVDPQDVANLSSAVVTNPMEDASQRFDGVLASGLHLHWALPSALTVGYKIYGRITFPTVPNRWLVSCRRTDNLQAPPQQWVVESDYLHPQSDYSEAPTAPGSPAITFPVRAETFPSDPQSQGNKHASYLYMGRCLELADWKTTAFDANNYLYPAHSFFPLTAMGYGEPTFAAYYPNCFSLFGFAIDNQTTSSDPQEFKKHEYQYDILGWYQDPYQDCVQLMHQVVSGSTATLSKRLRKAIQSEYNWTYSKSSTDPPNLSVCYGRLLVTPENVVPKDTSFTSPLRQVSVAVGNDSAEALSAHLGHKISQKIDHQVSGGEKFNTIIEEQLEAIGMAASLSDKELDFGPRFHEARHAKGFSGHDGGTLWSVKAKKTATHGATGNDDDEDMVLPPELAEPLNRLNLAQQAYDESRAELATMQQRMFAEWCKFIELEMSQPDVVAPCFRLPQYDSVRRFIKCTSLNCIDQKQAKTGELGFDSNRNRQAIGEHSRVTLLPDQTFTIHFDPGFGPRIPADKHFSIDELETSLGSGFFTAGQLAEVAVRVLIELARLQQEIQQLHQANAAAKKPVEYQLIPKAAPRFWQPNDPAVLIVGEAAKPTNRYGEGAGAEELPCTLHTLGSPDNSVDASLGLIPKHFQELLGAVDAIFRGSQAIPFIGFQQQTESPWHPIILEWETNLNANRHNTTDVGSAYFSFHSNYVSNGFSLPENAADLSLNQGSLDLDSVENTYTGRTILTPHAHQQLEYNLAEFLKHVTLADCRGRQVPDAQRENHDQQLAHWYNHNLGHTRKAGQPAPTDKGFADWCTRQFPFRAASGDALLEFGTIAAQYANCPAWDGSSMVTVKDLAAKEKAADSINSAIQAYSDLTDPDFQCLSQSLGGFHTALLMKQQMFQLPVHDPTAEDSAAIDPSFTSDVAKALEHQVLASPQPDNQFLPIRASVLQRGSNLKLRLVDSFGQTLQLDHGTSSTDRLHIAETMRLPKKHFPNHHDEIHLPPRLAQPARMHFRWMSADGGAGGTDEVEMNDHPASTPVCGWLVANNLNNSLMVYDGSGTALGSIDSLAQWQAAPGVSPRLDAHQIPNLHLRRLVFRLSIRPQDKDADVLSKPKFLQEFISTTNWALEAIEPESFAQHEALALLMGRPMAVVRASVKLETLGLPDVNEDWCVFKHDLDRFFGMDSSQDNCDCDPAEYDPTKYASQRTRNRFDRVQFPLRIGDYRQLNDGLVGYWAEEGQNLAADYYANASQRTGITISSANIKFLPELGPQASLSLADEPLKLTLLVDPRGTVHARTGILPTKVLDIPSAQYADVLKSMAVTFLTSPILTERNKPHLPLPPEPGYAWSWITTTDGAHWNETSDIAATSPAAKFHPHPQLVEGWLKLKA